MLPFLIPAFASLIGGAARNNQISSDNAAQLEFSEKTFNENQRRYEESKDITGQIARVRAAAEKNGFNPLTLLGAGYGNNTAGGAGSSSIVPPLINTNYSNPLADVGSLYAQYVNQPDPELDDIRKAIMIEELKGLQNANKAAIVADRNFGFTIPSSASINGGNNGPTGQTGQTGQGNSPANSSQSGRVGRLSPYNSQVFIGRNGLYPFSNRPDSFTRPSSILHSNPPINEKNPHLRKEYNLLGFNIVRASDVTSDASFFQEAFGEPAEWAATGLNVLTDIPFNIYNSLVYEGSPWDVQAKALSSYKGRRGRPRKRPKPRYLPPPLSAFDGPMP